MSLSRQLITQAWMCILPLRHFVGAPRLRKSQFAVESITGNIGLEMGETKKKDGREVESGYSRSQGYVAPGHRKFESGGQFGRSGSSRFQNGVRGRKPKMNRGGRRGGGDGFRMPEFDPGNDQLKKIFESQMDNSDPIGGLELGEVGIIEGNFRDDDDLEVEDFYKRGVDKHQRR